VPMSEPMVHIFEAVSAGRTDGFLFRGRFNNAIATSTVASALARIGVTGTRHGWRSVAKDVMSDILDIDNETSEFVLGHVKKGVEAAYRRQTAFAKRRVAMGRYALWLAGEEAETNVVPFVAGKEATG
jgi:hypothetical protein